MNPVIRHLGGQRWEGVPLLAYREDGSGFNATRQVLFAGSPKLDTELRYFEIESGGHSSLERHDHVHLVMLVRGRGHCLVGDTIHAMAANDLVHVPSMTWHQFRATANEPLGFLCLVKVDRDKPQFPDAATLAALRSTPEVGDFIRP